MNSYELSKQLRIIGYKTNYGENQTYIIRNSKGIKRGTAYLSHGVTVNQVYTKDKELAAHLLLLGVRAICE